MCLPLAVHRPDLVLESGKIDGFEYIITNNGMGYRCGYLRVEPGHPWHGKGTEDAIIREIVAHYEVNFAKADLPCDKGGEDNAWWLGFDCAHAGDEVDFDLPFDEPDVKEIRQEFQAKFARRRSDFEIPAFMRETVKTTDYVRSVCQHMAVQARAAVVTA